MLHFAFFGISSRHQITASGVGFLSFPRRRYWKLYANNPIFPAQLANNILFSKLCDLVQFFLRAHMENTQLLRDVSLCNFLQLDKLVAADALHHDIIRFHYYIQYHLFTQVSIGSCPSELLSELYMCVYICGHSFSFPPYQLSEAAAYARKNKVILKGDLPIGVDRNSVDTWVYPTLFRMNTATGAPPDYFDKNGQNWGFPTYNWEEMSKDNYGWWRARLTQVINTTVFCLSGSHLCLLLLICYQHVAAIKILHSVQDRPYFGFLQDMGASRPCCHRFGRKIQTFNPSQSGLFPIRLKKLKGTR